MLLLLYLYNTFPITDKVDISSATDKVAMAPFDAYVYMYVYIP